MDWLRGLVKVSRSKFFVHLGVMPAARGDFYEYECGPSWSKCIRESFDFVWSRSCIFAV